MNNTFYRAIQYLKYKKTKSIILVFLFTIMSSLILFSTTLDSTIDKYYSSLDNKNGIAISAAPKLDMSKGKVDMKSLESKELTTDQIEKLSKLPYVTDVLKSKTLMVNNDKLKQLKYDSDDSEDEGKVVMFGSNGKGTSDIDGLKISASSNLSLEEAIKNKTIKLYSGTWATKPDEIVLSERLAALNKISLNGEITLKNSDKTKSKTFKVVGIYKYASAIDDMMARMVPENTMYTTIDGVSEFGEASGFGGQTTQFYIDSIDNFEKFKADYYKITNTSADKVELTLNDEVYQTTIKPLAQLSGTIQIITIVTIIISSIIIAIISYLMIKERNYEIGVLYSLSESKRNIILQFIIENIILMSIAFLIALGINFIFSSSIINSLMNMDILSGVKNGAMIMKGGSTSSLDGESATQTINASFSIFNIVKSYVYLLSVIIFITIISIIQILLKRPKEIINS